GERVSRADEPHQLPPALAFDKQLAELLVDALGRAAGAGDHVHRVAELLQDRVVRDRADLPEAGLAVRREVRLPARDAAPGRIEQPEAERVDRAGVSAALE